MNPEELDPVRAEMLRQARDDAEAEVARAEAAADDAVAEARADAEAALARARDRGASDARRAQRAETARARRRARGTVLRARRDVYEAWREAVIEGVTRLWDGADRPAISAALTRRARSLLGPAAEIRTDAAGGLSAHDGTRLLDLTLPTLAARVADEAETEAGHLWTP